MSEKITILSDKELIGQGTHKKCYINPQNDMLCIKLPYNIAGEKDLIRELKYLNMLKKRGVSSYILPRYYGQIPTNIGTGHVFDLIKDYDGKTPLNLVDYLSSNDLLEKNFQNLVDELKVLKSQMLSNFIITMGLFPINILVKKDSESTFKLILINDMGSAALIPIEYYFAFAARAKINRRWRRFAEYIARKYDSPLAQKLARQIR